MCDQNSAQARGAVTAAGSSVCETCISAVAQCEQPQSAAHGCIYIEVVQWGEPACQSFLCVVLTSQKPSSCLAWDKRAEGLKALTERKENTWQANKAVFLLSGAQQDVS